MEARDDLGWRILPNTEKRGKNLLRQIFVTVTKKNACAKVREKGGENGDSRKKAGKRGKFWGIISLKWKCKAEPWGAIRG